MTVVDGYPSGGKKGKLTMELLILAIVAVVGAGLLVRFMRARTAH